MGILLLRELFLFSGVLTNGLKRTDHVRSTHKTSISTRLSGPHLTLLED